MRKWKFRNSLFMKIFSICLLCMIVPMLINLFYTIQSSSKALGSESSNSLSRVVSEKTKQVDLVFDFQFDIVEGVVNEPFMVDFFKEASMNNEIDQVILGKISQGLETRFKNADGLYENIFFANPFDDKVLVDGIGGKSVGYLMDTTLEAYYYEQLKKPGVATGKYMYSPVTGRPTLPITSSIVDESTKEVLSVFVIPLDVSNLTASLVKGSSEQNVNTLILDSSGLVIASNQADQELKLDFSKQDGMKKFYSELLGRDSGQGRFTLDGVENIASFEKNEKYGLYIVSYMPVEQYMENVDSLKYGILMVIILSIVIASIVILFVVLKIVKPIKLISKTAEQISLGDLTSEPLNIKNKDEIGDLAKSFNGMLLNLRKMVKQVSDSSEKVMASAKEFSAISEQSSVVSKQVAEAIQQVAAGAEEQSHHASNSSDIVLEVNSEVRKASENAQNVAMTAVQTKEKTNTGAEAIYSSISEIEAINQNVHVVADKIKNLGERSKEIGQIVGVINQIAEQTNLLALNAAIEAARAGEHGRGFAVVANEVRKLAEQSKDSSNQIKELVNTILEETTQTVLSMDETVMQSTKGIASIKCVETTMSDIQIAFGGVTGQIQEVSSATQNMSVAIEQLSTKISQINSISNDSASQTQEVSAAMEEQLAASVDMANSSTSMARLAEELQVLVSKFKI